MTIDRNPKTNLLTAYSGVLWGIALVAAGLFISLLFFSGGMMRVTTQDTAGTTAPAAAASSDKFSSGQKTQIEEIIRSYMLENPELFLEVQQELEKRLAKAEGERMKKLIAENADYLFRRADAPIAGDPKGDITVVEFFDYNCGYCKRSFEDVSEVIAKDPKIKFVFMEYPILSKGSREAATVALAARNQGKYWEVHTALLRSKGRIDGAGALKIASKLGLDMAKLKTDMVSDAIKQELEKVGSLAQTMGINGTPHFLIGDRNIPGAPKDLKDQILRIAAELRKEGCEVC